MCTKNTNQQIVLNKLNYWIYWVCRENKNNRQSTYNLKTEDLCTNK